MTTEKKIKQRVKLDLRRDEKKRLVLKCGAIRKDGSVGKTERWKPGKYSGLPRGLFFTIANAIAYKTRKISERTFGALEGPIRKALWQAAVECGCVPEHSVGNRITWKLKGKRLITFAILDFHNHCLLDYGKDGDKWRNYKLAEDVRERRKAFRSMEKNSGSRLRGAIVVLKDRPTWWVPAYTRDYVRKQKREAK